MKKRILLNAPAVLLALCAASSSAIANDSFITISGTSQVAAFVAFDMVLPPSAACGVYTECVDTTICFATFTISIGDTGSTVASKLAASINANCAGAGFSAGLLGSNSVMISGPAGLDFECCLFVDTDTAFCGPGSANDAIPLSSGVSGCVATNVCDGVPCNENMPHVGGLRWEKEGGNSGSPYCFGDGTGDPCPCGNTGGTGGGCTNSSGGGATMGGSGLASFASDTLAFSISGVNGDKPGLLLRGNNQLNGGLGNPIGDGLICTAGGSQRSQVQVTVGGNTTYNDWNGSPIGTGSSANMGAATNYQFWYRDPMGGPCGTGFNFTNAWNVTYVP